MTASPARRIEDALGVRVETTRALGGGDAARAVGMTLSDGSRLFVKTVRSGAPFPMEALGLRRMRTEGGVRVPEVRHVEPDLLALEFIDFGRPGPDFQRKLGERLAVTHSVAHDAYGFDEDHFIGVTPQKNQPWVPARPGAWTEFWWTHRLEPMIRRLPAGRPRDRAAALESRLPALLDGMEEAPRLIHGDLWSGNVTADEHGEPVIFDPAPSYSHPEAELGMTRMFGGFTPEFHAAYTANAIPMDGWEERLELHMLYHVLNHAVIFGSAYAGQAERILDRYA